MEEVTLQLQLAKASSCELENIRSKLDEVVSSVF